MRCPLCRFATFRRLRAGLARIFALSVLIALIGCDEAVAPLAPSEDTGNPSAAAATVGLEALANNRIVFLSYDDEEGDIFTISPGGSGLTRLTSWSGSEFSPAWSYDHQRIAFVRWRTDANKVTHSDIFIMNADGSGKHWARATPSAFDMGDPAWSPDGKRLVVMVRFNNSSSQRYLATLELSTGYMTFVGPSGKVAAQGTRPAFGPGGTSILYLDLAETAVRRFVPGGKDEILLTRAGGIRDFMLSPDATRLAYTGVMSSSNDEIFVLTLATKATKRLTSNSTYDLSASWSPDGTRLAFLSKRSGKYQVWTMNAATGGSLAQVTNVQGAEAPAWWH